MHPGRIGEFWRGRRVFITGITGFKGSWLALFLSRFGAQAEGYALAPENSDCLFVAADINSFCPTKFADIRDTDKLSGALKNFAPHIVFHLAAQPLVGRSYLQPTETFSINVQGTCNILEAARSVSGLESVIVVTSDKCYRNQELDRGYRETDELGGHDPYSASKAAAEIAVASWGASYYDAAGIGLATARAGNVIGGGDWADHRIVPDIVRAHRDNSDLILRYPQSIRPWQHVLDCINGYLKLAEYLGSNRTAGSRAWNFGPPSNCQATVQQIIERFSDTLPIRGVRVESAEAYETKILLLDSTIARQNLGWIPKLDLARTLEWTSSWYASYLGGQCARKLTVEQIDAFCEINV